jgi:hypothetical protein
MKVELDRLDLMALVNGSSPYFSAHEHPLIKKSGTWVGGHVDKWDWNKSELEKMSEEELYEIHKICRQSWGI